MKVRQQITPENNVPQDWIVKRLIAKKPSVLKMAAYNELNDFGDAAYFNHGLKTECKLVDK